MKKHLIILCHTQIRKTYLSEDYKIRYGDNLSTLVFFPFGLKIIEEKVGV